MSSTVITPELLSDLSPVYAQPVPVYAGITRVLAKNPSPFTYTGTGTYLVGSASLAVIDPGPTLDAHLDALLAAIDNRPVEAILVTHTHLDHSPLSRQLAAAVDAPIYGFGPHGSGKPGGLEAEQVEAGADMYFAPDKKLSNGQILEIDGHKLRAIHTPGHTSNHICFFDQTTNSLFSGDHIMGWSTTVISPPDGDMAAYLRSLNNLLSLPMQRIIPTHGPVIEKPHEFITHLLEHRQNRTEQILDNLAKGPRDVMTMVRDIYHDTNPVLHPAAARSVLAHLIALVDEGRVEADAAPSLDAKFTRQ